MRCSSFMCLAAGVAVLSAGWCHAADAVPVPKLLPPTVYGYVAVPDVGVFKDRLNASDTGALFRDPALRPAREEVLRFIEEKADEVREQLNVNLSDLKEIPSGAMAFAAVQVDSETAGPVVEIMMLLDHDERAVGTVDQLLEKAEKSLEERGGMRSVQTIDGTPVVQYLITPAAKPGDGLDDAPAAAPEPRTIAWFRKENRLVAGTGTGIMRAVLARWDGGHSETFANDPSYKMIVQKTQTDGRDAALFWYANPIGSLQTIIGASRQIPPQAQTALAFLPLLGVTKFKAAGGSFDFATERYDSISKVFLHVEQPPSGVLGLFQFPAVEQTPPNWVTDKTTSYVGMNWDPNAAYGAVRGLFDQFQGPGALDRAVENASKSAPNVHPKRDVIDQLTGRIHVVSYPGGETSPTAEESTAPTLFAIGVKDEQKMKDLLTRISTQPGFQAKPRDFRGTSIYTFPTRNNAQTMTLAVSNGNVIASNNVARLEEVIRGTGGEPLAQNKEYRKVAGEFPSAVSMLAFQDQRDQFRTMLKTLREQPKDESTGFDFSKLPTYEDIEEYLQSSGMYAVPEENGALFVNFSLKKD